MAFTQTDLDAINAAIATGELTVEYDDKRVTYRSMDDLLKAKSVIEGALEGEVTGNVAARQSRFVTQKGTNA